MSKTKSMIGKIDDGEDQVTIHVQLGLEVMQVKTRSSSSVLSVQKAIEEAWGLQPTQQNLHVNVLIVKDRNAKKNYSLRNFTGLEILVPAFFHPPPEVVLKLQHAKKEIAVSSDPDIRKEEANTMWEMVGAIKQGETKKAFDILDQKKHLLNGKPGKRHWSALHHVVYTNSLSVVQRILNFEHCDIHIHAKKDEVTKNGETPAELAKLCNFDTKEQFILARGVNIMQDPPKIVVGNSHTCNGQMQYGLPLFYAATAFMPDNMRQELGELKSTDFLSLTEGILTLAGKYFEGLRKCVADSLYLYSQDLCQLVMDAGNLKEFQGMLIHIFSHDHVYSNVNEALNCSANNSQPTSDDLYLSLYGLLLEAVLLHSREMRKYQGISYRGCNLNSHEKEAYKIGERVQWVSFASSSKSSSAAFEGNVKFIIDNQITSNWGPAEVDHMSLVNAKMELIHPSGSTFKVLEKKSKNGVLEIKLKLVM